MYSLKYRSAFIIFLYLSVKLFPQYSVLLKPKYSHLKRFRYLGICLCSFHFYHVHSVQSAWLKSILTLFIKSQHTDEKLLRQWPRKRRKFLSIKLVTRRKIISRKKKILRSTFIYIREISFSYSNFRNFLYNEKYR